LNQFFEPTSTERWGWFNA